MSENATPLAAAGNLQTTEDVVRAALEADRADTWTSLPVKVSKASQDGHTITLTPLVKAPRRQDDGTYAYEALPELQDVPIAFPGGGGVTSTYPSAEGDEGFVTASSLGHDVWHQNGGVQPPSDPRRHSLSDFRFQPGARSDPRKLKGVSQNSAQVRTDDKGTVSDVGERGVTNLRKDAVHQVSDAAVVAQKGGSRHAIDGGTIAQVTGMFFHNCG